MTYEKFREIVNAFVRNLGTEFTPKFSHDHEVGQYIAIIDGDMVIKGNGTCKRLFATWNRGQHTTYIDV